MASTDQLTTNDRPWTRAGAPSRPTPAPIPWVADALGVAAGLGLGVIVAILVANDSRAALAAPGGVLTALGRLTGLTGTYLMLIMIVLISRLHWLERVAGQDRLVRWHRTIGGWPIVLIAAHIVFITLGYAQTTNVGPLHQFWTFLAHYPDILASLVGFALLVLAGVSSAKIARRRLKYETWWAVHLYMYLALALAFAHQIKIGVPFLGHPLTRDFWIALWAGVGLVAISFRVITPLTKNLRYQLRVTNVTEEAPGVYSLTFTGKNLSRLAVAGGQFFQWRFFAKDLWWHSHPFSLSAMPQPPYLRITVKAVGDQSSALARVRPGTRVFVEGPYGTFTKHARSSDHVTLVGAGVGITPLRAILEDLPAHVNVSVVIRASSVNGVIHRDEIQALVDARGGDYHEVIGPRARVRLDARALRKIVPNLHHGDVYICGPHDFANDIETAVIKAGVGTERIHREQFAF